MAKFLPTGWSMSKDGAARFAAISSKIDGIVKKRVKKYNLAALDPDDLMQEGRLAAAYAVDTFAVGRGNLDGYISSVVSNALAMVAAEALAQSRQPYKQVQEPDGSWRRVPVSHVELEHETAIDDTWDELHAARSRRQEVAERRRVFDAKLTELQLSVDARQLLEVRLHTPPELWVLARNLNRGRLKLEAQSVCRHLGWMLNFPEPEPDRMRYQRAIRELREQFRYNLGVDEQTLQPIPANPIPAELYNSPKRRNVAELRA